jgi:hypothetical protein
VVRRLFLNPENLVNSARGWQACLEMEVGYGKRRSIREAVEDHSDPHHL